jgi:hypothetical protein
MNDPDQDLYVMTEGTLTDPLRATALHEAVAVCQGWLRFKARMPDDEEIEEILIVAERLHNWLRAEPGA